MKKALAILSIVALAACGTGTTQETTTDSTGVQVDSTTAQLDSAVTATDSTTAEIPVDGAQTK